MLQLSKALIDRPVLSLRTGTPIALTSGPIINPNNLKIEGFYCQDRFDKRTLVLLYQDIRDVIADGIVVNDHEALSEPDEIVRLKNIIELGFELIGKPVVTVSKEKVGKVTDFATEVETMFIQKLYVGQSLLKSFTGGSLTVDRNQIFEITNRKVIINDLVHPTPAAAPATI